MKRRKSLLSISALAGILLLVMFAGSASAGTAPQPGASIDESDPGNTDVRVRISGRVDEVSAGGILLTTRRGQVHVLVSDRTEVMVEMDRGCVRSTLRGIRVGGPAEVVGALNDRGVILARGVRQCRAPGD